jgi:hypothetical protein
MGIVIRKYKPEMRSDTQDGGWHVPVNVLCAERGPLGFRADADKNMPTAKATAICIDIEPAAVQMYQKFLEEKSGEDFLPDTTAADDMYWERFISYFLNQYADFENGQTYLCTPNVMGKLLVLMAGDELNLKLLKNEWDGVFKSPLPTREDSILTFLRYMGMTGIKDYDYEGLLRGLASPSGPVKRGLQQPSVLERYRTLSDSARQQMDEYIDKTLADVKEQYPEAYFKYLDLLDATNTVFES